MPAGLPTAPRGEPICRRTGWRQEATRSSGNGTSRRASSRPSSSVKGIACKRFKRSGGIATSQSSSSITFCPRSSGDGRGMSACLASSTPSSANATPRSRSNRPSGKATSRSRASSLASVKDMGREIKNTRLEFRGCGRSTDPSLAAPISDWFRISTCVLRMDSLSLECCFSRVVGGRCLAPLSSALASGSAPG